MGSEFAVFEFVGKDVTKEVDVHLESSTGLVPVEGDVSEKVFIVGVAPMSEAEPIVAADDIAAVLIAVSLSIVVHLVLVDKSISSEVTSLSDVGEEFSPGVVLKLISTGGDVDEAGCSGVAGLDGIKLLVRVTLVVGANVVVGRVCIGVKRLVGRVFGTVVDCVGDLVTLVVCEDQSDISFSVEPMLALKGST